MRRPRVLYLAYACAPGWGSEPGIGWNRAVEMAKYCDVWVVCDEESCRTWIEDYFDTHPANPHLHFVYVPRQRSEQWLFRLPGGFYAAYHLWHHRAYRVACQLHAEVGFDLTHQVTFGGYREPSHLWKLDVPFVWGPVGGTQNYPWQFLLGAGAIGSAKEILRNLINLTQLRFSSRVRKAARAAAAVFASNSTGVEDLKRSTGVETILLTDVGIEQEACPASPVTRQAGPLRILWSGVLETRKALELLIEAIALMPEDVECEVRILGEGSAKTRWQRLATQRGVDSQFRWSGQLPRDEAVACLKESDVFVFTSLRDTTGTVLVEAMASGTPIVCVDHQGATDIIEENYGFKVPPTNRRDVARRISEILTRVARNPELLEPLGLAAKQKASAYTWSQQAERIAEVYNSIFEAENSDCRCEKP